MSKSRTTGQRTGPTDAELRAKGFVPFIRPEHTKSGETLRLTGFNFMRERGTDKEQYVCEVQNEKGEMFNLGVRPGTPDHRALFHALGPHYANWTGSVQISIGTGNRGGEFVNVQRVTPDTPFWYDDQRGQPFTDREPGQE